MEGHGYLNCPGFRYIYRWSVDDTWGIDGVPVEGDSISIPLGMSLLVDIEDIPAVNLILVEGQLIFASPLNPAECNPNGYALDANYIFAFGGQIEIGNEDRPYEC